MTEQEQTSEYHGTPWKANQNKSEVLGGGEVCICSKDLKIVWGDDWRFWKQVKIPNGDNKWLKCEDGMELVQVCYLEVTGTLDLDKQEQLSAGNTYELFYIIKFKIDAFGWQDCPVLLHLVTPNGDKIKKSVNFEDYRKKGEGWYPVLGGEFTVGSPLKGKISFGIHETETPFWKGGIILHGVLIQPKK
ncbi:protein PHLOEM PROTEIN 2-LIKE A9-like [Dioscorea cayenensis subsp. rotundata]|uniref:Protein PHLOEM PROTEIN 2-LIKE A9-like n=1 Tax=Dioscorea cayennensis subsp. rotundata TaxID=55577 RepID=A0AB40BLZ4_DIOCR|nr:protein PHLOEM PROTEIN 2-LIKE A9-like [Dioscorea cayenensis subsp. rotundata]